MCVIGEPLRTIVVEPPVEEPAPLEPEPEQAPAVPDYISPIVGYRIWHWNGVELLSLNGEPWLPCQVLKASCQAGFRAGKPLLVDGHQAPQMGCTCGVYATKTREPLTARPHRSPISGEVYLWGTIVEHRCGWRAQFAYPKSFTLLRDTSESEEILDALAAYGAEINFVDEVPDEQRDGPDVLGGRFPPPGGSTPPMAPVYSSAQRWRGPRPRLPSRGVALAV